ncbi:MAG: hypothetical protein HQM14_00460 [SAR324 cluster bacterium]|nr:hypothetical protein [SAR324 cluster bacterium]
MENVVELKKEEAALDQDIRLGFIGWGMFGQGLGLHLQNRNSPLSQKGCIYQMKASSEEVRGWKRLLDLDQLFQQSNLIFLEASYDELRPLFPRIRLLVSDAHVLVFLGADISFAKVARHINERKIIRCLVSPIQRFADISFVFTPSGLLAKEEIQMFSRVLEGVPVLVQLESEAQLEAVHGLIGTGPAIGYTIIDALADGALKMGIPRKTGLLLAAHALFGATRTFLESEIHPGVLRDHSIQGKGIPLSGLMSLEEAGIRGIIAHAIEYAALEAQKRSQSD